MSLLLKSVLILTVLAGATAGYVFYESAFSPNDWIYTPFTS